MRAICAWTVTVLAVLSILTSRPSTAATVTLNPSQDNTLFQSNAGTLSNGIGDFLFTGTTAQSASVRIRRAAILFDIAGALPAGAIIDRVTLTLSMNKTISGASTVSLHRLTESWGEANSHASAAEGRGAPAGNGDATWLHRFSQSTFWSTPGGSFDATASAAISVGGNRSYTWGSTPAMVADVQSWLDNSSANHGWIIIGNESVSRSAKRFTSRDGGAANRPSLTIDYYSQNGLAGTVNSGAGPVTDVVLINGSAGGVNRVVTVPVGSSVTLAFNNAPATPSGNYALWVWAGIPCNPVALQAGPNNFGTAVNPIPVTLGTPQPFQCLRSPQMPARICRNVNQVNAAPNSVPWSITVPNGSPVPVTFTVQAIVEDAGASNNAGFSTTNAVILKIQ